jgi:hypothetical protein
MEIWTVTISTTTLLWIILLVAFIVFVWKTK